MIGRMYLERGARVTVLARWVGHGPRNVLIKRENGALVVRPFRGLRKAASPDGLAGSPISSSRRSDGMVRR
jgi:hypothetical protein